MNESTFSLFRIGTLPFAVTANGPGADRTRRPRGHFTVPTDEHDRRLLAQIVDGKILALMELYDIYHDELFRHAFSGHCDLVCAEHAVLSTFQTVWSRAAHFNQGYGTVRSWLMTTATMFASRECVRYGIECPAVDGTG